VTENEAREAVYAALVAVWLPAPTVSLMFDNEVYKGGATEWALANVHHTGGGQHSLGVAPDRIYRRWGLLTVHLNVALDKGTKRMDALARLVVAGLEGKVVGDVWFQDSAYREGGGGDGYRSGTVSLPFSYDEVK